MLSESHEVAESTQWRSSGPCPCPACAFSASNAFRILETLQAFVGSGTHG
jgi:hypothetical protein